MYPESKLLSVLRSDPTRVFTYRDLALRLGPEYRYRTRAKLDALADGLPVSHVWGIGYRLASEPEARAVSQADRIAGAVWSGFRR